jgi:hypothetical protein
MGPVKPATITNTTEVAEAAAQVRAKNFGTRAAVESTRPNT